MVWMAFKSVVVDIWVDCCAVVLAFRGTPCIEEAVEYIDILLFAAMVDSYKGSSFGFTSRCVCCWRPKINYNLLNTLLIYLLQRMVYPRAREAVFG